jgi:CheY-like chemotaxis protein
MADGGLHVLVVEDNAGERWLFSEILRTRGHVVTACEDAESAWEEFQSRDPDLVLLDWILPGVNGLELCRKIREASRGERCFILMVTGKDHPDALAEVLAAGADDYIAKPVDVGVLNIRLAMAERAVADRGRARRTADPGDGPGRDLGDLLDRLSEVVFSLDLPGPTLTWISSAATAVLGSEPADLIADQRSWPPLLMPDGWDDLQERLDRAESNGVCRLGYPITRPDGEVRLVEARFAAARAADGAITRVDGVLSDVTRAVESRRMLAEQKEELETLYRVSGAILEGRDTKTVVAEILPELCRAAGMPGGYAGLVDSDRGQLRILSIVSPDSGRNGFPAHLPLKGTAAGVAVVSDRLVAIDGPQGRPELDPETYRSLGIASEVASPLRVDGEVVGVLGLWAGSRGRPADRAIRLSRGVAEQLSVFMARQGPGREVATETDPAGGGADAPVPPTPEPTTQDSPAGKPEAAELHAVDLKRVVGTSLDRLEERLTERRVRVSVEPGLPTVHGNEEKLVEVFRALLADALDSVPAARRPEIRIRWETPPESVRILVQHNGDPAPSGENATDGPAQNPGSNNGPSRPSRLVAIQETMESIWGRAGLEDGPDGGAQAWLEFPAIGD